MSAGDDGPTVFLSKGEGLSSKKPDTTRVFVVHGRDKETKAAVVKFLHSIGLLPLLWEEAALLTNKSAPFAGEVLEAGFDAAQAVIVLLTGDDYARLGRRFGREAWTPQPRPNVLFEAGMALGRFPTRTILVQFGETRVVSNLAGRHHIQMEDSAEKRLALVSMLRNAGCAASPDAEVVAGRSPLGLAHQTPDGTYRHYQLSKTRLGIFCATFLVCGGLAHSLFDREVRNEVTLKGKVEAVHPVTVYVIGFPKYHTTVQTSSAQPSNEFTMSIPVAPDLTYRVQYVVDGRIAHDDPVTLTTKPVMLQTFRDQITSANSAAPTADIHVQIKASDEEVRRLLTK